jgi:uncharacterized protein with HEPN domain
MRGRASSGPDTLIADSRKYLVRGFHSSYPPIRLKRYRLKMVGFRNLAVHQYRELDLSIVEAVIRENLDDMLSFAQSIRAQMEVAP